MSCSASGSSSGLLGSVGQIWLSDAAVGAVPLAVLLICCFSDGPAVTGRSGKMCATDGSAASFASCAGVTVAATALIRPKPCRLRAPTLRACAISGAWEL